MSRHFPTRPVMRRRCIDSSTVLTDLITLSSLQTFKSLKFVVRVAFSPDGRYFATASYDRTIVIYEATSPALAHDTSSHSGPSGRVQVDEDDDMAEIIDPLDDANLAMDANLRYTEVHRLTFDSNPEAILFTPDYLIFTLRSSSFIHYVHLGDWEQSRKSLNPHPLDTHISFAVLDLALHPSGKLLACLTGDHRGGGGERVLLYPVDPAEEERVGCLWTGAETDDFVLPRMSWLPDGSGLM